MILPSKLYNSVKYTVLIAIPAFSTAYLGVDAAVDLPHENEVVKVLAVVATLMGTLVGISSASYANSEKRFDGEIEVNANDPSILHFIDLDKTEPKDLLTQKAVTLKVSLNHSELPEPEID